MAQRKYNSPQPPSYTPSRTPPVLVSDGDEDDTSQTPRRTTASDNSVARLTLDVSIMGITTSQSPSQNSGSGVVVTPRRHAAPPTTPSVAARVTLQEMKDRHKNHPPTRPPELKYYAIARGRSVAIVLGWKHAKHFVEQHLHRCFFYGWDTLEDAMEFLRAAEFEGKAYPILAGMWD